MQDRRHVAGISEPLPEGETLLWEGRPGLRSLVFHVLGTRFVVLYMLGLGAVALWMTISGRSLVGQLVMLGVLAAVLYGLLMLYGRMIVKSTTYAITDQRILIRKGIALDGVLNIPFSRVANLSWQQHGDGSGDIAIEMAGGRIAYFFLWPHARPWRFFRAQPSLRAIPEVAEVAETLRVAFLDFTEKGGEVSYQPGKARVRMMDEDDLVTADGPSGMEGRP